VFNYPFLQGNATSCLQKLNAVVITEATAKNILVMKMPLEKCCCTAGLIK